MPHALDHIVLRVSCLDEAAKFYRTLFTFAGWEAIADANSAAVGFCNPNGTTVWLEEHQGLEVGKGKGWLDHFALHCQSRDAVAEAFAFCKSNGWQIVSEPKAYPEYGSFYGFSFSGPDGITLEFVTR